MKNRGEKGRRSSTAGCREPPTTLPGDSSNSANNSNHRRSALLPFLSLALSLPALYCSRSIWTVEYTVHQPNPRSWAIVQYLWFPPFFIYVLFNLGLFFCHFKNTNPVLKYPIFIKTFKNTKKIKKRKQCFCAYDQVSQS